MDVLRAEKRAENIKPRRLRADGLIRMCLRWKAGRDNNVSGSGRSNCNMRQKQRKQSDPRLGNCKTCHAAKRDCP